MKASPGYKTICLPFEGEEHYQSCLQNLEQYRQFLVQQQATHPELFPSEFSQGFRFFGSYSSIKMGFSVQRIQLSQSHGVYQIRPSFLMPYMVGNTDKMEKGLNCRRYSMPYDALAYTFGRDSMFWYRAALAIGRPSIVGSTVKDPEKLPQHLNADEKITWHLGEKAYLTTTVANGCILGACVVEAYDAKSLEKGYGEFASEARELKPGYSPKTVCLDGSASTQEAWKSLFMGTTIILCFLHSVLKVGQNCVGAVKMLKGALLEQIWNVYSATKVSQFSQRVRRLREWSLAHLPAASAALEKVVKLCSKRDSFKEAFAHTDAYRTSNAVDRLIDYQDRRLYSMRYFHGLVETARMEVRSQALLWNFHTFSSRTRSSDPSRISPFHDLNGFKYHQNWLHNFLIASSLGGHRQ